MCNGNAFGVFTTETFQLLDQYGDPFVVGGLTVQENISPGTESAMGMTFPTSGTKGWVTTVLPGTATTDGIGKFQDSPFGGCTGVATTEKFAQQYRVSYGGAWYYLQPTLDVTLYAGFASLVISTQLYTTQVFR